MRFCLPILLALAGAASAADPPRAPVPLSDGPDGLAPNITGPDRIEPYTIGVFTGPMVGQVVMNEVAGLSVEVRGTEIFVTGRPGKYVLSGTWIDFEAKKAGKLSKAFMIGDPPPPPPPPTPPGPIDPLTGELRTIYAADTSPTKAADVAVLREVYSLMAVECGKDSYKSSADLESKYQSAVTNAVDGRLIPLRTRCSVEILAAMPSESELDAAKRAKLTAVFTRLARILPEVTK